MRFLAILSLSLFSFFLLFPPLPLNQVVTLWYRPPEILLGVKAYALPTDMWSIGAIIAEMCNKRPLFPGDSEIDEIFRIFRMRGTPSEATWPGVTSLQDWNEVFPVWPTLSLSAFVLNISDEGLDLIQVRALSACPLIPYLFPFSPLLSLSTLLTPLSRSVC